MSSNNYRSVISQPGSATRNVDPILAALAPLVPSSGHGHILELASYPYEHIRHYAAAWPGVKFTGTVRDAHEISTTNTTDLPSNVFPPKQLDVALDADWEALDIDAADGVVMLNLVHCTPEGHPEHIFRHLSPKSARGRRLLAPGGWIAAYGAYLNDDGSFRSEADAKFDAGYIKGMHPSLGLRTPVSITAMAEKWGFREVSRADMPKGNLWIVWRTVPEDGDGASKL